MAAAFPDNSYLEIQLKDLYDSLVYCPFDEDAVNQVDDSDPSVESGSVIFDHPAMTDLMIGNGAALLAETGTNVMRNPSYEINVTDDWLGFGSVLSQVLGGGKGGDNYLRCGPATETNSHVYTLGYDTGGQLDGETWTLSFYAKLSEAGSYTIEGPIDIQENGGSWVTTDTDLTLDSLTTSWQYYALTGTFDGTPTVTSIRVVLRGASSGDTPSVDYDCVQLEQKDYATPYCDGSLGTGHAWAGTAHNSVSTRTLGLVAYEDPASATITDLTFSTWYTKGGEGWGALQNWNYLFHYGDGGANGRIWCAIDCTAAETATDGTITGGFVKTANTTFTVDTAIQPSVLTPIHIVVVYTDLDTATPTAAFYINGSYIDSVTGDYAVPLDGEDLMFGNFGFLTNFSANGWMDDTYVVPYEMTATEILLSYYEGADGIHFSGVWTDILEDVRSRGLISWRGGINGNTPKDRTAGTGTLEFRLKNDETNSAGLLGYYSVGHANARTGFELGKRMRLWFIEGGERYYHFVGTLTKATPTTGKKRERETECRVVDWLAAAAMHKVDLLEVADDIRSDVAIERVIENLTTQPDAVSYGVGQETFTYWGDDLKDERTTGLAAVDRITMSEFGYSFIRNGAKPGEFVYQNRHARVLDTTVQHTFTEADLAEMNVRRESSDIRNRVEATVYPREIGSSTETLYSLSSPLLIGPGEIKIIKARYTDPGNRDVRLAGKDLFGPEGENLIETRGAEDADLGEWFYSGGTAGGLEAVYTDPYKEQMCFHFESGTGASETGRMLQDTDDASVALDDIVYWAGYLKIPDTWPQFTISVREYDSGDVGGTVTVLETIPTPANTWTRYHGEHTAVDADCDHIRFYIGCNTVQDFSGGQVEFYADEITFIKTLNFEFSTSDAGGGDKNGDLLLLDSTLGGNAAEFVLENVSEADGYVTLLQVKGTAIRTYDPVMQFAENEQSQKDHYKRTETLSLRYQDDPLVGQDWADKVLSDRGEPQTVLENFDIHGHRSAALLAQVLGLAIGERVAVAESVSAIDDEYFIQGADYRGQATPDGMAITVTYNVVQASTEAYWILGIEDSGELGWYTWLGF